MRTPSTLRVHAYARRSHVRVQHTMSYTGGPDLHPPVQGQHAAIATSASNIIDEDRHGVSCVVRVTTSHESRFLR